MTKPSFTCGVIEGFYGQPWTPEQRRRLLSWMQDWQMNAYFYGPKDDIKHRALWRELYDEPELAAIRQLVDGCRQRGVEFVYAIAPGLDLRYGAELPALQKKLRQIATFGVRTFAVLFDDIPHAMQEEDKARFGTFAGAQVHVANELLRWLRAEYRDAALWFCPTIYCGRYADHRVPQNEYLRELGSALHADIAVMWTGPEIISETISVDSIREVAAVLRRKPLIWDNLHANDYDFRRIYLGPFAGRPLELRAEVSGILSNPNCEFEANFIPWHTLAAYSRAGSAWDPRDALRAAREAWWPAFQTRQPPAFSAADLELLIDLFYLPYSAGPRAEQLVADFRFLVRHPIAAWEEPLARFERTCADISALAVKLAGLADRGICFTFYRYLTETNREALVARGYVAWLKSNPPSGATYQSPTDFRPGIYRGGISARLQELTRMDARGAITLAPEI